MKELAELCKKCYDRIEHLEALGKDEITEAKLKELSSVTLAMQQILLNNITKQ